MVIWVDGWRVWSRSLPFGKSIHSVAVQSIWCEKRFFADSFRQISHLRFQPPYVAVILPLACRYWTENLRTVLLYKRGQMDLQGHRGFFISITIVRTKLWSWQNICERLINLTSCLYWLWQSSSAAISGEELGLSAQRRFPVESTWDHTEGDGRSLCENIIAPQLLQPRSSLSAKIQVCSVQLPLAPHRDCVCERHPNQNELLSLPPWDDQAEKEKSLNETKMTERFTPLYYDSLPSRAR